MASVNKRWPGAMTKAAYPVVEKEIWQPAGPKSGKNSSVPMSLKQFADPGIVTRNQWERELRMQTRMCALTSILLSNRPLLSCRIPGSG